DRRRRIRKERSLKLALLMKRKRSSSNSDIPVTTTTTVGRPFKGPLSTYEVGRPSSGMGTYRTEIVEAHKEAIKAQRRLDKFIWLEVASVDRYRLECDLYSVRTQMHAMQQELYWRGFKENCPTESIDVLATYGDADPPELQEPSDTQ
ncbi:hypothetical protein Tco_1136389, partial [Tanacetum coccineum]